MTSQDRGGTRKALPLASPAFGGLASPQLSLDEEACGHSKDAATLIPQDQRDSWFYKREACAILSTWLLA